MSTPFNLQRFVDAQDPVIDRVRAELTAGRKETHWMWFVFPQLRGLGSSPMAERYGIASLDEARAYLDHPVLGPRLKECAQLAIDAPAKSARALFGKPDDLKFRSSMTLFTLTDTDDLVFNLALARLCDYGPDALTVERLRASL